MLPEDHVKDERMTSATTSRARVRGSHRFGTGSKNRYLPRFAKGRLWRTACSLGLGIQTVTVCRAVFAGEIRPVNGAARENGRDGRVSR